MPRGSSNPEPSEADGVNSLEDQDRITLPVGGGSSNEPVTLGHFRLGEHLGSGGMGSVFEAHDTALDRTVAIKLLRAGSSGEKGRARLLREAQALARLKHPNVVTVFEVGVAGDEVFVAMELVEGGTLREWMVRTHGWREVTDLFLALGRGLAAAHALGLVHRDVKPANIFLDLDGTPKLGDFGLVSPVGASDEEKAASPQPALPEKAGLTTSGKVMGTPAYMSPEQYQGQPADARADQFAYCATFHEALTGRLPARGGDRRQIPQRLRRILDRGLDSVTANRYPSMDALLKDLAQVRRGRTRLWLGLAGAAALVAATSASWTVARARELCPPPTARLDAAWGATRRAAVRDHLLSVDREQGATRFAAVAAWFDPDAAGLRDQYLEACRATRIRGTQSDTLLDLRMRCLDRRFTELEESVSVLAGVGSAQALDGAVAGAAQLSPLAVCADVVALSAVAPLPEKPEDRAKAEELGRRIQQVAVRVRSDDLKDLPAQSRALVDEARKLGNGPTLVAALQEAARVQTAVLDNQAAKASLQELTLAAARVHDNAAEAFAWTRLVLLAGSEKSQKALDSVPAAAAAVARAGDPVELRVDLLSAEAHALGESPQAKDGVRKFEEAQALLEKAGAAEPGSPLAPRLAEVLYRKARAMFRTGSGDETEPVYRRAIAIYRQAFGPDSQSEAAVWQGMGNTLKWMGKREEALEAFRTAARIKEQRSGESPSLAFGLTGIGALLNDLHRWGEALQVVDRSLRIYAASVPASDPQRDSALMIRSESLRGLGRLEEAWQSSDQAVTLLENAGRRTNNLAISYSNRGELSTLRGRCADALKDDTRSIAVFEEIGGKDNPFLVLPLVGQARCLLSQRHPEEAFAALQRLGEIRPYPALAASAAKGRFYLARAQFESGRDKKRGRADAAVARAAAAAAGADAEDMSEMDQWLAGHR
jgi:serine/threonine protein kinase